MKRRIVAVFLLVLHLAGCYTWQPVPPATLGEFILTFPSPDRLRIEQADGARMELRTPFLVTQDSLRAVFWASKPLASSGQWSHGPNPVSFAFTDITSARAGRYEHGKSTALKVGLVLGGLGALAALAASLYPEWKWTGPELDWGVHAGEFNEPWSGR